MSKARARATGLKANGLETPERREGERSQPDQSGGASNPIISVVAPGMEQRPIPDPEVSAKPQRRRFTAEYKRSIVEQAEACQDGGAIGALLRREGLYSSHLATWRRQCRQGELAALAPKKRGRTRLHPLIGENRKLVMANARLTKRLENAEFIIEVQKKLAALLGNPIADKPIDEGNE